MQMNFGRQERDKFSPRVVKRPHLSVLTTTESFEHVHRTSVTLGSTLGRLNGDETGRDDGKLILFVLLKIGH
jgi:hypothetical protein